MTFRTALVCGGLLLAGCAANAPREHAAFELRLSPASLGREMALQQQLTIRTGQEQRTLDALLEVDASEVKLDIQTFGRSAVRLRWDGKRLDQQRAAWLPKSVRGEQILADLQLAQWPVAAIRAALPGGWSLTEAAGTRELRQNDVPIATVRYPAPDRIEIEHADYRLSIQSAPVEPSTR